MNLCTKTTLLFTLSILILGFIACTNTALNETPSKVAELIQRSEKIQLGKEWDAVQNNYAKNVSLLKNNKDDNQAKLELANLFIKEARVTGEHGHYYPGALKLLNSLLEDNSIKNDERFLALLTKAGVQLSLHDFADALETGEQAVKLNPYNAQIYGVLVDAHVELGNYETAVKFADKMVSIKPDIRSYSRVSYLREIHGNIEGAKKAMHMAVDAGYPGLEETAWAMLTLGEIYNKYGDPTIAQEIYEAILAERKHYPFAVAAIGDLALERKDFKVAEAKLEEAIDIIPEVGFYISLAHLYKEQNRKEELNNIKEEIFEMLEDDVVHGHNMNLEYASTYLDLVEDPNKAMEYVQLEYDKRPDNIDVNKLMAKIYTRLDNTDMAEVHKSAAFSTNAVHPELDQM
jgi:tetratricopeptide (TPR) repeat protein